MGIVSLLSGQLRTLGMQSYMATRVSVSSERYDYNMLSHVNVCPVHPHTLCVLKDVLVAINCVNPMGRSFSKRQGMCLKTYVHNACLVSVRELWHLGHYTWISFLDMFPFSIFCIQIQAAIEIMNRKPNHIKILTPFSALYCIKTYVKFIRLFLESVLWWYI